RVAERVRRGTAHSGLPVRARSRAVGTAGRSGCGAQSSAPVAGGVSRLSTGDVAAPAPVAPNASPAANPSAMPPYPILWSLTCDPYEHNPPRRPLPLPRDAQEHAHAPSVLLSGAGLRSLDHQLIDEQERHAGLQVVEQLLQRRLVDLAARHQAHVTLLRFRA